MPGTREAARAPKPRANELVRTEAMLGNWVTTERHRSVSVSDIRRRLLIHANGERDVDALSELLAADLRAGVFSEIGAAEKSAIENKTASFVDTHLAWLWDSRLLA
jgi:hypothetical protein